MKITDNATLNFHPIFIPLDQLSWAILDLGFWIADLLYRFALSFFIKLNRRRRTLNPNSKIQNSRFMRNKSGITFRPQIAKKSMILTIPVYTCP
jgi:hypothetical protein